MNTLNNTLPLPFRTPAHIDNDIDIFRKRPSTWDKIKPRSENEGSALGLRSRAGAVSVFQENGVLQQGHQPLSNHKAAPRRTADLSIRDTSCNKLLRTCQMATLCLLRKYFLAGPICPITQPPPLCKKWFLTQHPKGKDVHEYVYTQWLIPLRSDFVTTIPYECVNVATRVTRTAHHTFLVWT